jgi:hypothetical protein
MGQFRKYDHLERGRHPDVSELGFGVVHVFPKLDGTNASVWAAPVEHPDLGVVDVEVKCGSRARTLSKDADNAGFHAWVHGDSEQAVALRAFVTQFPHLIVYGEWLVPHTLKTYREDAWRRFYVFDVYTHATGKYLPYEVYADPLAQMGIDVIQPLAIIENPSENDLIKLRDEGNTVLMREGEIGEGIVLKNYDWANKWGRQPWAKMVRETFNNGSNPRPKLRDGGRKIEQEIVDTFCSDVFIRKTWSKVVLAVANEKAGDSTADLFLQDGNGPAQGAFVEEYRHKIIPRFIGTVYWDFIEEETRTFVKKLKNPVVDFSKLQKLVTIAAKRVMKEIF